MLLNIPKNLKIKSGMLKKMFNRNFLSINGVCYLSFPYSRVYHFVMYKLLKLSILLLVTSTCLNAKNLFDEKNEILKPSDAFATSGYIDNDLLYINWRINNGYYLYKNSVKIMNGDNELEYIIIESNETAYEDEFFGKTQILRGELFIRTSKVENLNNLLIYFQGCSDSGFCYPLQSHKISQIIF